MNASICLVVFSNFSYLSKMIRTLREQIQNLLARDVTAEPLWKRFFIRSLQITVASGRDIADGQLSLQAMGLVYTTLITLVPLLAISFSVLKGFGVHNQIEPFLLNILQEGLGQEKSAEITDRVIGFVDNIQVGVLGTVGLGLLIYAVIALMQKIESAFNHIWRVGQDRTLAQRFSDYLSVLLMGPLLIFISAGITTTVRHSGLLQGLFLTNTLGELYEIISVLLPWLVMAIGFTFIYVYMPNTKVKMSAAFIGALVAAFLWKTAGYAFSSFIASSANYIAIYAAFATLIVLMLWIYTSWMVILFGSNIAFYVQYPRYIPISREPLLLSPYIRVSLGLSVLTLITRAHYNDDEPWTIDGLSQTLHAPVLAIQKIVNVLEDGEIITASQSDPVRYYPACPFSETPLQNAIDVLERQGMQSWYKAERVKVAPEAQKILDQINDARLKAVTAKTITQALLGKKS